MKFHDMNFGDEDKTHIWTILQLRSVYSTIFSPACLSVHKIGYTIYEAHINDNYFQNFIWYILYLQYSYLSQTTAILSVLIP